MSLKTSDWQNYFSEVAKIVEFARENAFRKVNEELILRLMSALKKCQHC
jgi:hypothetical protein